MVESTDMPAAFIDSTADKNDTPSRSSPMPLGEVIDVLDVCSLKYHSRMLRRMRLLRTQGTATDQLNLNLNFTKSMKYRVGPHLRPI
jgi:hypothetical protein